MSDEEKHEWDRQPGESTKAYAHFCLYRDMGQVRSLRKLVEDTNCISKIAQLQRWSAKWRWVTRGEKYDDHLELQDRMQQEKERREMHKRHAKIAVLGQNVVVKGIEKLLADLEQGNRKPTASDLGRLLDVAVKVERLARGEPSDSHEVAGPDHGPVKLSLEETLRQIAESYGLHYYGSAHDTRQANDATGTLDPKT
jgi:chromatin segregation and condensation protein Rec8/ScpA/Scc1 (kleisin family)